MTYGVQPTGFVKKPLSVIREEIQDELRDTISTELDLLDTSLLGQIEGIFSDKLREMWDVCEAVYRAMYPDSASNEALDQVASITGVVRLEQTKSTVTLRLWVDDGTTVTTGSIVSVGATGSRFVTLADVANSTGATATFTVEAESEEYGPIVGYAESIDTIQTPIAGWSAAAAVSGTNTETFSLDGLDLDLIVDKNGTTQNIAFSLGNPWSAAAAATTINGATTGINAYDDGNGKLRIASSTEGPGSAIEILSSGTANSVLGLTAEEIAGMNALDADPGRNIETDPDFRARRDSALRSTGSATVEAILAALILTDDVEQAFVIENVTNVPVDGVPAKAFESIVLGGTDSDIADTIWREKPAGILAHGSTIVTVTDSQGFDHDIGFTRPSEVRIYLRYDVTIDSNLYPADGDDQIKAAAVAYANTLQIGQDAIALEFQAVALNIAGVIDVPLFRIDTTTPPTGTSNITITTRQLASVDTGDVTVNS
jgi:uncharacterized phage protein gp47/JayE